MPPKRNPLTPLGFAYEIDNAYFLKHGKLLPREFLNPVLVKMIEERDAELEASVSLKVGGTV